MTSDPLYHLLLLGTLLIINQLINSSFVIITIYYCLSIKSSSFRIYT